MSRVDWGRVAHQLWRSRSPGARLARAVLLLPAGLYRLGVLARNAAYDAGALGSHRLPRPSLGVGNLVVGGAGKTPIASYLAAELARRGVRPGILLRGYSDDETREHEGAVPDAVVEAGADRLAASQRAAAAGAEALVLDDCFQRRDVRPDVLLVVVSAEAAAGPRWPPPAGPWREGFSALARADAVVVSRKTASEEAAAALAARLAVRTRGGKGVVVELSVSGLRPLGGAEPAGPELISGRDVVALCGIGEPELFAAQLAGLGGRVRLVAFGDHHAYDAREVRAALAQAGSGIVVTTAKDAVKLAGLWPAEAAECWVATLEVRPGIGREVLERLVDRVADAARAINTKGAAATPPSRGS